MFLVLLYTIYFKLFSNLAIKEIVKLYWSLYFDIEQEIWKVQMNLMLKFSALAALQKLINSVAVSLVSKPVKYFLWQLCWADYWNYIS